MAVAANAATAASVKVVALEADARELAQTHRDLERTPLTLPHLFEESPVARALERAQKHLTASHAGEATLPKTVEWFLDNYYLIRRVARQVDEDLPSGFVRHLPRCASGPSNGLLRIDAVARALVAKSSLELDAVALQRFVEAYQEVTPLTIAELWALPTLLRTSVLQRLLQFLDELHTLGAEGLVASIALELDPEAGVERAIRTLRVLDAMDWKTFFANASRVEAKLREDPAKVYARMDFETCDSYRKVVEALAWATRVAEPDVADLAVKLAREAEADARRGHVGYYLVADGRRTLEERLGYRAAGLERLRRAVTRWPMLAYLLPVALLTSLPLLAGAAYLARAGARPLWIALVVMVAAVPASVVAVTIVQSVLARLIRPRTLPKLDFTKGLSPEARTLVVIPTLLGRVRDVDAMIRQVELHYLSNPDPQLQFALLTDDVDAKSMPDDAALLDSAERAITALNAKHGKHGVGPFHLLHREPRWNPAEQRFMGWERKRGKLEELNRLLRGDAQTSYARHVGDAEALHGIRFVITLDSDTELPMESAHRLVGVLAHPLNRAVFDETTGRVSSGYTIVQPRIETSPSSSRQTRFSRIFAGDIGLDIYTHAVSELYQDLFGSGIYVGKGIYDVDAFARSVEGRVPENALVSHDLFEGVHGRAALATDIVLFEDYPSNYAAYAKRMHRWVRGDWQLFPWVFPIVPSAGASIRNQLALIDRWKIVDNLRRSLTSPLFLLLLVVGWIWPLDHALLWTLGALVMLLAPLAPSLVHGRRRIENLGRCALAIAFLAYEAELVADAIVRVIARKMTRKHLLQWTSAAQTASEIEKKAPRKYFWQTMAASPLVAIALAALIAWGRPSALVVAAPLLAAWFFAPEIARWISLPLRSRAEPLRPVERRKLRLLARRTWRFFDVFVGPNDQWLPIDNYQEAPHEQTARRTSPTNIGLMLVATLSAYDFGYIGASVLSLRLRRAFDSITRLSHYQGHLLNWYDTKNLQPLLPHYVSTVDSGNFAGCLLALKQGCKEAATAPVLRAETWEGLGDSVDLMEEIVESTAKVANITLGSLRSVLSRIRAAVLHGRDHPEDAYATLCMLEGEMSAELHRELLAFLETGAHRHEADVLHALRTSIDSLDHTLQQQKQELDSLLSWLALKDEPAARTLDLPSALRLDEIPAVARRLRAELEASPALDESARRLVEAFRSAEVNAQALHDELIALATRAEEEARGMDFRLLYDAERKLFHIGYNATLDRIDAHHYDLLASEARLASYLAIVKRDVPEAHWYALGRPMTSVSGAPTLLSWGGTMFEYLMPNLFMRSQAGTLLARTSELAVVAQIAYGKENKSPWGISESAFARRDAHEVYQYRSFGVPGLGFKRGLDDDHVITPYASLLAVSIRPRAVAENVVELESMGMLGTYGLFEALDLTPERALVGHSPPIVHSYMAHHQGMLLIALGNLLNDRSMVDRFHADPLIESGEMLLNEHAPDTVPREWPTADDGVENAVITEASMFHAPSPWTSEAQRPQAFTLSNGNLTSLLTDAGGGGLVWNGIALTRYQPDSTHDEDGVWIYLRDEDTGRVSRATAADGRTTYAMHKAEFHRRHHGISARVDVAVAPTDDVEVRLITLHNETSRTRHLSVTTAARPVLVDAKQAPTHPAFSSMFVESERVADLDGLLFARRPQSASEKPVVIVHRLVHEGSGVAFAGGETDRNAFYGRSGNADAPLSLAHRRGPLRGRVGSVIDPTMSLMARVELKPNASVTLAFVTTVGRSRSKAVALARKYGSMHAVRWAFHDAEQECPRRLQRTYLAPALLPFVQRLFSALLFADPTLRASAAETTDTRPCKSRLWGRGISGDDPIVLVRVSDPEAPIVAEVLAAQRFLRSCGVRIDLVLVDEHATGYASEGSRTLRRLLAQRDDEDWLNRHGGIYVIGADQIPDAERAHLEACARVVLDTHDGSLASRFRRTADIAPRLPRFEPTLVDEAPPPPSQPPRPKLLFHNGTGGFTEDGREYVLTGESPAPWCNVIANAEFGCLVSESSLGATWSQNSGENRLTPWRNDPVFDTPSEVLYLRDEETAAVWSPTPLPAGREGKTLVRHGAGYTTYERETHGLEQELTVFVPPNASLKIVRLRIKNTLTRHRRLTATYYAEWVLGSRREQKPYITAEHDRESACLFATCNWNAEFGERVAFLASEKKAHGFTADRTEFLGRRGDYAHPEALERWGLSGCLDRGIDPCAALQVHLELAPGEAIETHFVLGQASNRGEAAALVARFRDPGEVERAFFAVNAFWDEILGDVRVKTPEPAMDLMLNRWLLYQTLSARIFGRTGFYQSSGAFGYRDQLQDVLALLHASPERARAHILESAAHQFEEGDVLHWWHPPSGRGVRTRCSDDLAWLVYVTAEYVAATGDAGILDEQVPFLKGAPLHADEHDRYAQYETAPGATLREHCRRALERAVTKGPHGLPHMGDGDWNDGMNRVGAKGRGESVWLGWFLCACMDRFANLCGEDAASWRARAESLRATIKSTAWDGAWYLRAFHDDGSRLGSATNTECRIDSIAQSWAVLSRAHVGDTDVRASASVRAADDQLVREADRLVLLLWPPFSGALHDPGYIRAYPPGVRENGGQYTHAATWLGFAHAALGDGERAERIFRLLNPILHAADRANVDRYRVEPYALAGDVYSCPPWVGRGGWSWYTGAAAWMWRLGVEAILGLRKEDGHLRIDPCIPPRWKEFEAWVRAGAQRVHVVVENPDGVASGIAMITLDGVVLDSNRIVVDSSRTGTREVRVRLGSAVATPKRDRVLKMASL